MADLPKSADFVINNERCSILLRADAIGTQPAYVSFTGSIAGSSGQCDPTIRAALGDIANDYRDELVEILDAWATLHLKNVADLTEEEAERLDSAARCFILVHGERFGAPGDLEDLDDATFSNADDIIDSRDVVKRIEELEGAFEAAGLNWSKLIPSASDYDAQGHEEGSEAEVRAVELKALKDLEDEATNYSEDWRHGSTLIAESHFTQYAEDYAGDLGAINEDATWPANHIDWEAAATELKQDYTEVDFDGVTYLVR